MNSQSSLLHIPTLGGEDRVHCGTLFSEINLASCPTIGQLSDKQIDQIYVLIRGMWLQFECRPSNKVVFWKPGDLGQQLPASGILQVGKALPWEYMRWTIFPLPIDEIVGFHTKEHYPLSDLDPSSREFNPTT